MMQGKKDCGFSHESIFFLKGSTKENGLRAGLEWEDDLRKLTVGST